MTNTSAIGQKGEDLALQYLRGQNYLLYARNVQVGYGEIDIICYDKAARCLVFVEVKTRTRTHPDYSPASDMHFRKRVRLQKAIRRWLVEHEFEECSRTDLVYVIGDKVVEHKVDIFRRD